MLNDSPRLTDKILADCPNGCGLSSTHCVSKALCHLWWAHPQNKCAEDWKKVSQGQGANCNQYTWAYDEMGYTPASINQIVGENGFFYFNEDGNPQVKNGDHYISRESPNKPLVYCHLRDDMVRVGDDGLKNNPLNVNISVNGVLKSASGVSQEEKTICEATQSFPKEEMCIRNGSFDYYLGSLARYDPNDDIDTTMFKCLQDGDTTTVRPIYKSLNGSVCNASGIPGQSCTWTNDKCYTDLQGTGDDQIATQMLNFEDGKGVWKGRHNPLNKRNL